MYRSTIRKQSIGHYIFFLGVENTTNYEGQTNEAHIKVTNNKCQSEEQINPTTTKLIPSMTAVAQCLQSLHFQQNCLTMPSKKLGLEYNEKN